MNAYFQTCRFCLALLAVTFAVPGVGAEVPPALATPKPFTLRERTDVGLENGLKLTLVAIGSVPKATVSLVVRTGAIDEGAQNGLADFAGDYLKEGAGSRSAAELAAAAADMGGALDVSVGADETTRSLDVLSEKVPEAIALLADVLRRPQLPPQELARLRANAIRAIAVARTEAQTIAATTFAPALWGKHPYGRGLPDERDIAGYRVEDVRRFVTQNFGAARTHVYVAGVYDAKLAERATREAFSDWARGPAPTVNIPTGSRKHRVIVVDRAGAPQSTLLIGLPTIDPTQADYIALSVSTTLFGGGLLSRLDQDLRETRGWTYGMYAHATPYFRSADWSLEGDVITAHTTESVVEILKQLKKLQSEPPSPEELKRTQNYRTGVFVIGASSRRGIVGQLTFLDLHGLPADWLRDYATRVYAVTPAQVSAVFARLLPADQLTYVIVGDSAKFVRELKALPELAPAMTQWTAPGTPQPPVARARQP